MTVYTYDTLSRLKTIINANSATALTLGYLTSCETYNPTHLNCELPISATDSEGRTVTFVRDALDRIQEVVYPDGTKDVDTYANLDLTSSKDRLNRTTTYAYDLNRRLKSVTDPLNHVVKYDYYRNGELQKLTDENNKSTTWNLDAIGRLGSKTFADNTSVTYTYDTTGKLRTTTDALAQVKTFGYYSDDMLASITYTNAANPTPNVAFAYDPWFQRLSSMADGIGTTQWTYVPLGANGALSVKTEDGPFNNDSVTYGYDELGRVSSMTVGNSPAETWHYDLIGRVDQHVTALGTFNFTYLGQTDSVRTRALAGTSISSTWSYDSNTNDRRLTAITHSNGARSFSFGYQRFGGQTGINPYQITSIGKTGGGLATELNCNQYDDDGRLLNVGKPTGTPANCSQTQTSLYSFVPDPAGNLTTFTTASGTVSQTFPNSLNQIATSGARTFTFDAAGRETTDSWAGGGWNYKWDAENRLVRVDFGPPPGNTQVASIRYDGLGRRLEVIHQAGSMSQDRFTWCGSEICAKRKVSDNSIVARYFDEGQTYLSNRYVVTKDQLGSATGVVDVGTGALVGTIDYTPFGQITLGGAIAPDFAYAGLYLDRDLGLYYSNSRAYDPSLGRWISRDQLYDGSSMFFGAGRAIPGIDAPKLSVPGDANLYAYVANDPVSFSDPLGTELIDPIRRRECILECEEASVIYTLCMWFAGDDVLLRQDCQKREDSRINLCSNECLKRDPMPKKPKKPVRPVCGDTCTACERDD